MKSKLVNRWKVKGHLLLEYNDHWETMGKRFTTEGEAIEYIQMAVKAANSCA